MVKREPQVSIPDEVIMSKNYLIRGTLMKSRKNKILFIITILCLSGFVLNAQELYVGANYHPHDNKQPDKIKNDIQLMKAAGLNVVRMGHLAWDSYEPSDGIFDFEWFDYVMDMMNQAGIKVILDIAIRPAPIWLHHRYPSIDIVDANGDVQYPNHRYMEDIGDPMYQKYALRFADTLTKRYGKHPALLAFGIDNEAGVKIIRLLRPTNTATAGLFMLVCLQKEKYLVHYLMI